MSAAANVEVLLVEDNPHDAELTRLALARRDLADRIHRVEDGAEALDFLFGRGAYRQRDVSVLPKLVLLDLKMPKVGGLDVLRALRQDSRTQEVPVVVLTSSGDHHDVAAAYALGVNGYVVKPVRFDELLEAVGCLGQYWLRINEPPPAPKVAT